MNTSSAIEKLLPAFRRRLKIIVYFTPERERGKKRLQFVELNKSTCNFFSKYSPAPAACAQFDSAPLPSSYLITACLLVLCVYSLAPPQLPGNNASQQIWHSANLYLL